MKKIFTLLLCTLLSAAGSVFAQAPKKVILEDYTGAWCGYCPRGLTYSNAIENQYPNVIPLGIHQGSSASSDAMATTYTNTLCGFLTTGFPTGGVDRYKFTGQTTVALSTNLWAQKCLTRLNTSAPLNVYINSTYNSSTRVVDVTVISNFVAGAVGDLRVHCLLVEDSVVGSGPGWDQHNYMGVGCGATDPSSPWYSFPCTITGYSHRHVVRQNLANYTWGEAGIIPDPAAPGQNYSKTFTYTLPASWDDSKMEIVAFVSRYGTADSSRYILNCNKVGLGGSVLGVPEPIAGTSKVSGLEQNYPNPFSDVTNINFTLAGQTSLTLKVYDILGKEVATLADEKLSGGRYQYVWDGTDQHGNLVPGGLYFYRLSTPTQVFTGQMTYIRN
jgi:hypothetical protein